MPAEAPNTKKAMAYERPEGDVGGDVDGGGAEVWGGVEEGDGGDMVVANAQCWS
jgi:hypothetical protein